MKDVASQGLAQILEKRYAERFLAFKQNPDYRHFVLEKRSPGTVDYYRKNLIIIFSILMKNDIYN
jgi:hypothetical protein